MYIQYLLSWSNERDTSLTYKLLKIDIYRNFIPFHRAKCGNYTGMLQVSPPLMFTGIIMFLMGQLHDGVVLLLPEESFSFFLL